MPQSWTCSTQIHLCSRGAVGGPAGAQPLDHGIHQRNPSPPLGNQREPNRNRNTEVAVKLAKEIDRLSTAMITHGDCKASNIIVTGDHQPYFVDLDGAIQHRSRSAFRKAYFRDARRFRANWLQNDTGELFSNVFSDHPLHS